MPNKYIGMVIVCIALCLCGCIHYRAFESMGVTVRGEAADVEDRLIQVYVVSTSDEEDFSVASADSTSHRVGSISSDGPFELAPDVWFCRTYNHRWDPIDKHPFEDERIYVLFVSSGETIWRSQPVKWSNLEMDQSVAPPIRVIDLGNITLSANGG